jgi:hypothetical protein
MLLYPSHWLTFIIALVQHNFGWKQGLSTRSVVLLFFLSTVIQGVVTALFFVLEVKVGN